MARKGQSMPRTVTTGLRQRAWWILRNRKSTTIPELLSTLADGHEKDAESNIGRYLRALVKAGILTTSKERVPGTALTSNGHKRYVLVVDCGEDAPVWRASRCEVYVPGSGEVLQIPPLSHPPLTKGGRGDLGVDHGL